MKVIKISYFIAEFPAPNPCGFYGLDRGEIYIQKKFFNPLKRKIEKYFKDLEKSYMCNVSIISTVDIISNINCLIHTYEQFLDFRRIYASEKISNYKKIEAEEVKVKDPYGFIIINSAERRRCINFFSSELRDL